MCGFCSVLVLCVGQGWACDWISFSRLRGMTMDDVIHFCNFIYCICCMHVTEFHSWSFWKWHHCAESLAQQCCYSSVLEGAVQQKPLLFEILLKCVLSHLLFRDQFVVLLGKWPRKACSLHLFPLIFVRKYLGSYMLVVGTCTHQYQKVLWQVMVAVQQVYQHSNYNMMCVNVSGGYMNPEGLYIQASWCIFLRLIAFWIFCADSMHCDNLTWGEWSESFHVGLILACLKFVLLKSTVRENGVYYLVTRHFFILNGAGSCGA